jgi:hypothetical protein
MDKKTITEFDKKSLSGWQNFQIWYGRIALIGALPFVIYGLTANTNEIDPLWWGVKNV